MTGFISFMGDKFYTFYFLTQLEKKIIYPVTNFLVIMQPFFFVSIQTNKTKGNSVFQFYFVIFVCMYSTAPLRVSNNGLVKTTKYFENYNNNYN